MLSATEEAKFPPLRGVSRLISCRIRAVLYPEACELSEVLACLNISPLRNLQHYANVAYNPQLVVLVCNRVFSHVKHPASYLIGEGLPLQTAIANTRGLVRILS
jgi:hypothetical protein